MVSQKLVDLIEKNADELTKRWLANVKAHAATPTYHTWDEKELSDRAFTVYSQLGKWISRTTTKDQIAKVYTELGRQRRKEGFALSEVIQALIITRRHVWLKVIEEGFLDTALNLHLAMELNNRVVVFFDRAIYYAALGYGSDS